MFVEDLLFEYIILLISASIVVIGLQRISRDIHLLYLQVPYSLNFLREKNFVDFTDFCQTTKILTLKFLSSLQFNTILSVIHEIFIQVTPKFTKISPLENFRLYGNSLFLIEVVAIMPAESITISRLLAQMEMYGTFHTIK